MLSTRRPWYFILAAEMLFRTADNGDDHGIDLDLPGGNLVRLEYADDAALLCNSIEEASSRLSAISVIGREMLDAEVSIPKTKAQRLQQTPKFDAVTNQEADSHLDSVKATFDCPHLNCPRRFETKEELNGHLATCEFGTQEL